MNVTAARGIDGSQAPVCGALQPVECCKSGFRRDLSTTTVDPSPNSLSRTWDVARLRPRSPPPVPISVCDTHVSEDDLCLAKSPTFTQPQPADCLDNDSSFSFRPKLRGFDNRCRQGTDFYQPFIRQFRNLDFLAPDHWLNCIRHPPVIEPVTMATVWKGLTLSDCNSLASIQKCFISCLEQLLEGQFTLFQAQLLSAWQSSYRECSDRAECLVSHRYVISKPQLIQAMSDILHVPEELRSPEDAIDMKELLMLYLWSRDCMLDLPCASGQTAINTRDLCSLDSKTGCPQLDTITALCTPDYLSFEGLNVLPHEGSEILIKPYYRTNAPQRPGGPHTKVTYSLGPDEQSWLHWDTEVNAFRGRLPGLTASSAGSLPRLSYNPHSTGSPPQSCRLERQSLHATIKVTKLEVKALIVVAYPGSRVRLERTIQVRIALRITPSSTTLGLLRFPASPNLAHDFKVEREHKSVGLDTKADASFTIANVGGHLDQIEISDITPHLQGEPSGHTIDASTLPGHTIALDSDLQMPETGSEARPFTKLTFSNVPGIDLRALEELKANQSHLNRIASRKEKSAHTAERHHLSDDDSTKENKCSQAAEIFDAQCNSFDSKNRQWRKRYLEPVTSVKQQTPQMSFDVDKLGPASRRDSNTTRDVHKNVKSVVDRYASITRRQDRCSKITSFLEELRSMQSMSVQDMRHSSSLASTPDHDPSDHGSSTKHDQGPSSTCTHTFAKIRPRDDDEIDPELSLTRMLKSRRAAPKHDYTSTQKIILSNRYALLPSLSHDSDAESFTVPHSKTSSIGSGSLTPSQNNDVLIASRPIESCSADDNVDGGDPYAPKERMIIHRISTMKEAMEAYREPGLSNDEREQKWKAMKKSLETESTSRNTSRLVSAELGYWEEVSEALSNL